MSASVLAQMPGRRHQMGSITSNHRGLLRSGRRMSARSTASQRDHHWRSVGLSIHTLPIPPPPRSAAGDGAGHADAHAGRMLGTLELTVNLNTITRPQAALFSKHRSMHYVSAWPSRLWGGIVFSHDLRTKGLPICWIALSEPCPHSGHHSVFSGDRNAQKRLEIQASRGNCATTLSRHATC